MVNNLSLTAREVAKLTLSGTISCRDLVENCIERIVSSHKGINAVVVALSDQARQVRAGEETDRVPTRDRVEMTAKKTEENSAGLPVGVQAVSRQWREDVTLAIMSYLETFFRTKDDYPLHAFKSEISM